MVDRSRVFVTRRIPEEGLAAIGCGKIAPDAVRKLDAIDAIPDLREVGRGVAVKTVNAEHFDGFPSA